MMRINGFDVIRPSEVWTLWPFLAVWFVLCGLGFARAPDAWPVLFVGLGALGVVFYLARPDSPLRRLGIARSIVGTTPGGVLVRRVAVPGPSSDVLLRLTDVGLDEARLVFAAVMPSLQVRPERFAGKVLTYRGGRLHDLAGAHDIPSNVEPGADGLGTVGILESDNEDTIRDRVRFLGLRQLLASTGDHGTEAQHRASLKRLGVEERV
jgi:uncharacterized protein YjeT (DUF2065 family)